MLPSFSSDVKTFGKILFSKKEIGILFIKGCGYGSGNAHHVYPDCVCSDKRPVERANRKSDMGTVHMKPSPAGFHYVLERFPQHPPSRWISVGYSWIDGKASAAAGIPFIAYRGNEEVLAKHKVKPAAAIDRLDQLPALLGID